MGSPCTCAEVYFWFMNKVVIRLEVFVAVKINTGHLGSDTMYSGKWVPTFWKNIPASIFTLKVKTVCFSEMLITIYQTTWCHYSEDHSMNPGSCTEAQTGENSHRLKQI